MTQIVFAAFLAIWFTFLGLSVMWFDAPGSENNVGLVTLFCFVAAYPLGLLGGIISSWILFGFRKYKLAYWLNCIPLVWIVPIVVFWSYALLS